MRQLVVNSLGEVFLGDEYIAGSINVCEFEQRLGRKPNEEDFNAEFDRQIKERLDLDDYETARLVLDAQARHADVGGFARVQFYLGQLRVEAEFKTFKDTEEEQAALKRVYDCAYLCDAEIHFVDRGLEQDQTGTVIDMTLPEDERYENGNLVWKDGPNHNRPYVQLAVSLLPEQTHEAIDAAFDKLKTHGLTIFTEESGVGIL